MYNEWKEHSIKHHHLQIPECPQLMLESAYFTCMIDNKCVLMHLQKGYTARRFQNGGEKRNIKVCFSTGCRSLSKWHFFEKSMWHARQRWFILPSNHPKSKNKHGIGYCRCRREGNTQTWLQLNPQFPPAEPPSWLLQKQQEATDHFFPLRNNCQHFYYD